MATSCGWLRGVPQPSRRTSERPDPLALLPPTMQTIFNLKSCMYVHLLNLMRPQAQIVAFGAILRPPVNLFNPSGNRTDASQSCRLECLIRWLNRFAKIDTLQIFSSADRVRRSPIFTPDLIPRYRLKVESDFSSYAARRYIVRSTECRQEVVERVLIGDVHSREV